ncbi:hypothetical protein KUTeg_005091 [Tegillarca granosa]|uniref:BRCT domain-containing protein n=1 Tax=Tegillarca granosa TaxID=220873 RepID=A0ABQ9FMM2_TEGGR|nr:hypothetical protein KUTeg_005091 [Tegillarca granosa]
MAGKSPIILLMPQKIQKQRLKDMKASAKKKNIVLAESYSSDVTHIVTEYTYREQVIKTLPDVDAENIKIVGISWFTSCLKSGSVLPVEDHHRLQSSCDSMNKNNKEEIPKSLIPEYACQRSTPLKHHNEKLTKALEILQMNAEMRNVDEDYSRALAFRRASCVLKSLPFKVTNIGQVKGLKDMGRHCKQVIKDILEEGSSKEVDDIINSEWIQKMKLLFSFVGLAFHDDLMSPVTKSEAENVVEIIRSEAEQILPGVIVKLTGGFSRIYQFQQKVRKKYLII